MDQYTDEQIDAAAAEAGITTPEEREKFRIQVESAATWFRIDSRSDSPVSPSQRRDQFRRVERTARDLLGALGLREDSPLEDGLPDGPIRRALEYGLGDEGELRLRQILVGLGRIRDVAALERQNTEEETKPPWDRSRNPGNVPINDLIAALMAIYEQYKPIRTSVGAPDRPNEGEATGPLVRFLKALLDPLLEAVPDPSVVELSEDAIRSRVRTLLKRRADQR